MTRLVTQVPGTMCAWPVRLVAAHGWRLLPDYRFDLATGLWRHRDGPVEPPLRLDQVRYDEAGELRRPAHHLTAPEAALTEHLEQARRIFAAAWVRPGPTRKRGLPQVTGSRAAVAVP